MRKLLAVILTVLFALSICGCEANNADHTTPTDPTDASSEEASIPETTIQTVLSTEPSAPITGELLLSVSQITFSLVGESEDIYTGSADRAQITWESADESIALFENGVLTATGVGSTTVSARIGDQKIECRVGCLASTQDELNALNESVLRSPKRLPPVLDNSPLDFFDDAVFVGDSISYILFQYETIHGSLGNPKFLTRGGTSLNGFVLRYKNIYYQGVEMYIEDAVAATGANKVFIMLGQNDLGYRTVDDTIASMETLIERIREKSPDIEVYIQSCVYEWFPTTTIDNSKNETIDLYNQRLMEYTEKNGYYYVDIQQFVSDHTNRMATEYSMDQSIHLNEAGCIVWMQALNAFAYQQMIGGSNS